MQVKFLKSIVENLIGKTAVPIVDLLFDKKNVNEFLIAKKLNLTINQTRNILYKMSDIGMVSFIRKKDKRKGWYIYFWTLNIYQSLNLLVDSLKNELVQLEMQLRNRNEKRYYMCATCSIEVTEETALINDFTCQECEQIYQLSDNREMLTELDKNIIRVKKEIEAISEEIAIEEVKRVKKKFVKIKRLEKEAKVERQKKKEIRDKIKKKLEKDSKKKKKPEKKISKHRKKSKK